MACATVMEELLPHLPAQMSYQILDFGLHLIPNNLRETLQKAIDSSSADYETLILGYGLCSMAIVGLQTKASTIVIPRVDDCIAIFLGSKDAYDEQAKKVPGTYYLTKGWIEVGDTPFEERQRLVEQYDEERANRVMEIMLKHYTRLAYIDTGQKDQETYREYARQTAEKFNLSFEEIRGSDSLIKKLLFGPWDEDILVVPPGRTIHYLDFKMSAEDNKEEQI